MQHTLGIKQSPVTFEIESYTWLYLLLHITTASPTHHRSLVPPGPPCGGHLQSGRGVSHSGLRRPDSPGTHPGMQSVWADCCTCSLSRHRCTALLQNTHVDTICECRCRCRKILYFTKSAVNSDYLCTVLCNLRANQNVGKKWWHF